ncbi:hypothetical protein Tco_1137869, partial [Tanacetum coccineum]
LDNPWDPERVAPMVDCKPSQLIGTSNIGQLSDPIVLSKLLKLSTDLRVTPEPYPHGESTLSCL